MACQQRVRRAAALKIDGGGGGTCFISFGLLHFSDFKLCSATLFELNRLVRTDLGFVAHSLLLKLTWQNKNDRFCIFEYIVVGAAAAAARSLAHSLSFSLILSSFVSALSLSRTGHRQAE